MAATATPPAAPGKTERYEFVEDVYVDALGRGERVLAEKGQRFTAELAEEVQIDRRGLTPVEVPTGQFYVVKSDAPFDPGCLTSCIRTGRAMTPEQIKKAAAREAARKAAKK